MKRCLFVIVLAIGCAEKAASPKQSEEQYVPQQTVVTGADGKQRTAPAVMPAPIKSLEKAPRPRQKKA